MLAAIGTGTSIVGIIALADGNAVGLIVAAPMAVLGWFATKRRAAYQPQA